MSAEQITEVVIIAFVAGCFGYLGGYSIGANRAWKEVMRGADSLYRTTRDCGLRSCMICAAQRDELAEKRREFGQ